MVPQNIVVKLEMFFLERKTLCDSAVTDKTLRLGGTSDAVVRLEHPL